MDAQRRVCLPLSGAFREVVERLCDCPLFLRIAQKFPFGQRLGKRMNPLSLDGRMGWVCCRRASVAVAAAVVSKAGAIVIAAAVLVVVVAIAIVVGSCWIHNVVHVRFVECIKIGQAEVEVRGDLGTPVTAASENANRTRVGLSSCHRTGSCLIRVAIAVESELAARRLQALRRRPDVQLNLVSFWLVGGIYSNNASLPELLR
mmetsp:Transcript_2685/g.7394  ORF Transcript_2685/g.7394 Transcript_2685/m.7394 type:complete len:203 (-) Transcript_2685:3928-4536(-)